MKPINNLDYLKTKRQELRHKLTPAEATLWKALQGKGLDGRKFRRQHSIGNYILDFYCPAEKLAIELDGRVHNDAIQSAADAARTLWLNQQGIRVLRFRNDLVFEQPIALLDEIVRNFGWRKEPDSKP